MTLFLGLSSEEFKRLLVTVHFLCEESSGASYGPSAWENHLPLGHQSVSLTGVFQGSPSFLSEALVFRRVLLRVWGASKGGFLGDFSTKSWKERRDLVRMRSFSLPGPSGMVSLRLSLIWVGHLHFLAFGMKNRFLVTFHLWGWTRLRIKWVPIEYALSSTVGLGPRTLFILQVPATDSVGHGELQGITSTGQSRSCGLLTSQNCHHFSVDSRGVTRAGKERHWRIGRRIGAFYNNFSKVFA